MTLLWGFVPTVFERDGAGRDDRIVRFDEIRPSDPNRMPLDFQLNGLELFGFCREAIRRRVKPLVPGPNGEPAFSRYILTRDIPLMTALSLSILLFGINRRHPK